jgi:predicted enzyme related to lactoylglutathione lyase
LARPNTLIYVDLPSDDPGEAGRFYEAVLGWADDPRSTPLFHRMVPGGYFPNPDGSPSKVNNLHVGVYKASNARPHPDPEGAPPRYIAPDGRKPRVWVLVGEGHSEAEILDKAVRHGARVVWRDHYWTEMNGYSSCFRDPWGNEIVLWTRGGPHPNVPPRFTRE